MSRDNIFVTRLKKIVAKRLLNLKIEKLYIYVCNIYTYHVFRVQIIGEAIKSENK